MLLPK